jgi:hypothetical protein
MAHPGGSRQSERHCVFDVAALGQFAHARRRDHRRRAEIEVVQCFDPRQVRVLDPVLDGTPLTLLEFGCQQRLARTVSSPPASLTSATTTRAPSRANRSAAARPMPDPPPVRRATLPVMVLTMSSPPTEFPSLGERCMQ